MKVIEVPGLDRLDHSATITQSTLRSLDGIIVAYNRNSHESERRARQWADRFQAADPH